MLSSDVIYKNMYKQKYLYFYLFYGFSFLQPRILQFYYFYKKSYNSCLYMHYKF